MLSQGRVLVFDLETQRAHTGEREGFEPRALGLAAAVVYDSLGAGYRSYLEEGVEDLVAELARADLIVGYNVKRFDYEVLSAYSDLAFADLPTLDILEEIQRVLGTRLSLDEVARATLGVEKSASGLQAVRWYQQGRLDLVIEYCQRDVELTKALYEHGLQNGLLYRRDKRGLRHPIPVSFHRRSYPSLS